MSILLDYNGVAVASVFVNPELSEGLVRHFVLNSIRFARSKFLKEYGEVVVCCDSPNSWRKDIFPQYKANRKKSQINWEVYHEIINRIKLEIQDNFPYKVIYEDRVEADDIIATIAAKTPGPHLIYSNDKDMLQLKAIQGVDVYSPSKERLVVPTIEFTKDKKKVSQEVSPQEFLKQHIIKGDSSDGVPNILSQDDVFLLEGVYQKSIERKFIDNFDFNSLDDETKKRFFRNSKVISLFMIPKPIETKILEKWQLDPKGSHDNLQNYFIVKQLSELYNKIGEF